MKRTAVSVGLAGLTLVLGVATAEQAVQNRARGEDLSLRHRDCERRERQNELRRVENERLEWLVLHGHAGEESVRPIHSPSRSLQN